MTRLYRVPKGCGDRPATRQDAGLPRLELHDLPGAHPWRDYDVVDVDARPKDEKAVEAELREQIKELLDKYESVVIHACTSSASDFMNGVDSSYTNMFMALIKSSNLALLERVEKEILTVPYHPADLTACYLHEKYTSACSACQRAKAIVLTVEDQVQKLSSLRKEYER